MAIQNKRLYVIWMWLFYLNLNFTAINSKCKIKWKYNNFSENSADEPNADELNADEINADEINADEHIADDLNAQCWSHFVLC